MPRCKIGPALVTMLLMSIAATAGCSFKDKPQVWEIAGGVFGTEYHVRVVMPDDKSRLQSLSKGLQQTLNAVDHVMSTYKPDSELSRFNRAPVNQWVPVSDGLYDVVSEAQQISRMSHGKFDITVGPLVNLWGFGPDKRPDKVPSASDLAAAFKRVGYQKLELRDKPPALRKTADIYVDLSAIAKGYGVDQAADYLKAQGLKNYLVEIGGEVATAGHKPDGSAWHLAIEEPVSGAQAVNRVVALSGKAMATSGDYRNFFMENGIRYSHTIDPATGRPIQHNLASVSVIAKDCMTADGLATMFDVMGEEQGYQFAIEHQMPVYMIQREKDGSFQSRYTPSFSGYLVK